MYQMLEVFQLASGMAAHAGQRQALIAENIANADTPEFQARDITPFKDLARPDSGTVQKATRSTHLHGISDTNGTAPILEPKLAETVNGNSVSLEQEMLKAVDTKRQHDRALSIYKSALTVLHKALESR